MKKILILGAAALALSACGKDDGPEAQMQQAIDEAARFNRICVPYRLNVEHTESGATPAVLGAPEIKLLKRTAEGGRANAEAVKQMEQLVRAGLYQEEKEEKTGEGKEAVRRLVYSLTDSGKEHIRIGHHGAILCVGSSKVEKINYFTEPTPHRGYTVTQVNYTARIVPEKWAKSLLKSDKTLEELKHTAERSTTLVKTNDGWRDIRELD